MTPTQAANKNLRTFYTLVITQTLSLIGSRISGLGIGIWIFNETGDVLPLALVATFAMIPQAVLSTFAGVLADRWDRRHVMALSDAGQAVGTVILLLLFATGTLQLWQLYIVTILQAFFGIFQQPAFSASITMLVPDEHRDRANTIQQLTGPASGIVAPVLAGVIFAAVGVTGAIVIDLVTFVIAFVVVLLTHIPRPRKTQEGAALAGTMWQEMIGGFRYLWDRPVLFKLALCLTLVNFLFTFAGVLFTPYILARTGSETLYGITLGLMNAGGLVGGILMSIWGGTRPRVHTIFPGLIIMGIFAVLMGVAQTTILLMLVAFCLFFPNLGINAMFMSIMQVKVAPDVQGRVFAAIGQMAMLAIPIANVLGGYLADTVFEPMVNEPYWSTFAPFFGSEVGAGMGLMFVIAGSCVIVLGIAMYAYAPFRTMERDLPDFIPEMPQATVEGDDITPDIALA